MFSRKMVKGILLSLVLVLAGTGFAADPTYQSAPPTGTYIASGIADLSGPGGKAYVEYWAWDGADGYYYYTYQIHNTDTGQPFLPYVKHLTISNPTGQLYIVTGCSGGYQWDYANNKPGNTPGVAWSAGTHASLPTLIDWVAPGESFVFPYKDPIYGYELPAGQSSWDSPKFQYVSKLPPSMAGLTIRQGDLSVYAAGLIAAPGLSTMQPRSQGYWKNQYTGKGKRVEADSLPGYQDVIGANSEVFAGMLGFDLASGAAILSVPDNSNMKDKAKCQLFALWLNVVSGKLNYSAQIVIKDPAGATLTVTAQQVIADAENTILNPSATLEQLEYAKDMAEILDCL